jgi:hypothetical protein
MSTQTEVSIETAISVGRANNMWVIGGAGSYLDTITKRKGQIVVSYDTTGSKAKWHIYVWDDVASAWVDVTNPVHTHTGSTTGGEAFEIDVDNANRFLFNDICPTTKNWPGVTNSGTGSSITDDPAGGINSIMLQTGTTTTGYATIFAGGPGIDSAARLRWSGAWELNAITNILFRWGIGVEDPNAASDNNHKIGIEWCDSQATPNYYTLSANGTSRSLVDSGVAMAATTQHGCRIVYYPASKAQYKFWNGTIYDKTGILPSGIIAENNLVRWGLKNNNGGSANRKLDVYGTVAIGKHNVTKWPV